MHFPKFNYKVTLIVSVCLLAFGIGFGIFAFPKILKKMVTGVSSLKLRVVINFSFYFIVFSSYPCKNHKIHCNPTFKYNFIVLCFIINFHGFNKLKS